MSIRIDLPPVTMMPGAKAHPYPIRIALQTQEFIQAAVFHAILMDMAAGQRVRQSGAVDSIETEMRVNGMPQKVLDQGWSCLTKYKIIFEGFAYQNTLIVMRSHWDWYIRKLGRFVAFARDKTGGPSIPRDVKNAVKQIGQREMPIEVQLDTLRKSTGLPLEIESTIMEQVKEMSLVRNLGLHNRWEVDERYVDKTTSQNKWVVGELRLVQVPELMSWRQALTELIQATWIPIAQLYVNAPDYPI